MPIKFVDPEPTSPRIRFVDDTPKPVKRRPSAVQDVAGAMANVNRGLGIGDELAAGFATLGDVVKGDARVAPRAGRSAIDQLRGVGVVFKDNMANQRGVEDDFASRRPMAAALARGTGNAATAAIPAGGSAALLANAPRVANVARGAVTAGLTGAAYAATDRGTGQERLRAASSAATNPVVLGLGGALGAVGPARAPIKKPPTQADTLRQIGVTTSIPQRMGGAAKQTEDLAMRAPILGPAISGARGREVEQLNRGIALKALQPIGAKLPKAVKPGFETVQYVDDALGKVYNDAADLVPSAAPDQQFADDLASIAARKADLDEVGSARFDSILRARLNRLGEDTSGAGLKQMHGELGALQSEAAKRGEDTLAGMLGDTRRALMGIVERASPEAGAMIRQADEGWQIYSIMNDAAASATNRGGVFLPGQLNTQVRAAAKRQGSNMAGKGLGPMQDIATAATSMIPDQFGNPGTANAIGLGGLIVGAPTNPVATAGAVGGLGAAATPYFLMGRKVLEELPPNATPAQLNEAAGLLRQLAGRDPAVADIYRQVAARLGTAGAVAGASALPASTASSQ